MLKWLLNCRAAALRWHLRQVAFAANWAMLPRSRFRRVNQASRFQPSIPSRAEIATRVAAGFLGGYGFVWGFSTLGIALCVSAGMQFGDAAQLFGLVAFLVFLTALCWAFVARSWLRVWAVLGGGGALMAGAAWLLSRTLI